MEIPEYCIVDGCNEEGENAHVITRATLPKALWDNRDFWFPLCRRHHNEQHNIGIESFCNKYGLESSLRKAKEALRNMTG